MTKNHLPLLLSLMLLAAGAHAQNSGSVIPFQGQLATQAGLPLSPTNALTLVFRLYQTPVGGAAIWEESQPNISVSAGRFSVLLGSRTQLPAANYFNSTLYLGITVDDGDPTTADVEMRPRQALVPVISAQFANTATFATAAASANTAGSANTAAFATNAESLGNIDATNIIPAMVPIGSVLPFYGNLANLPSNWQSCDGSLVSDLQSPFNGQHLPDLRQQFVRGADSANGYSPGTTGGQDYVPDHSHYAYLSGSSYVPMTGLNGWNGWQIATSAGAFSPTIYSLTVDNSVAQGSQNTHGHTGTASVYGDTYSAGGHDNRPQFFSLYYIIRIK